MTLLLSIVLTHPTYAAQLGSGVLITEFMAGSGSSAGSEFVELYNQSDASVDVTGWKIQYQTAANNPVSDSWSTRATLEGSIMARSFLLAASTNYETEQGITADASWSSTLPYDGGKIRIITDSDQLVDSVSYGTAVGTEGSPAPVLSSGYSLKRHVNADAQFIDENENSTDFELSDSPYAQGGGVEEVAPPEESVDLCNNLTGEQAEIPEGYESDGAGGCMQIVTPPEELEDRTLTITELFPNPLENEDNNEFIEIYNPQDEPIGLDGYIIYTGNSYNREYVFTGNLEIGAKEYLAFYSSEINITLANSGSRAKLVAPAGNLVSETESYTNSKDEMSWSLFEDGWKFSEKSTPDAENEYVITEDSSSGSTSTYNLKPCRSDQFRNPETNRCKLKSSSSSSLKPCAADQYRNPETNRCRKIGSSSSSLTPCKVGQYRNPETNRCRKIESASSLKPCQPGYERNPETNRCRKATSNSSATFTEPASINPIDLNSRIVAILIFMAGGYALYEYRTDITNLINRLRNKRGDPRPPG